MLSSSGTPASRNRSATGDQCPTHSDEILSPYPRPRGPRAHLQAAQPRVGGVSLVEPHVILLHDNDIEGTLPPGVPALRIGTQSVGVEGFRFDRAAAGPSPASRGSSRVPGNPAHLRGVPEDERQHLRAAVQIGVDLVGRDDIATMVCRWVAAASLVSVTPSRCRISLLGIHPPPSVRWTRRSGRPSLPPQPINPDGRRSAPRPSRRRRCPLRRRQTPGLSY